MTERLAADDRQPARRRDPGRRLPAVGTGTRRRAALTRPARATIALHARRQPHDQRQGLPDHPGAASTSSAATPSRRHRAGTTYAPTDRQLHQRSRPARPTSRSARTAASPTSTRTRHRRPTSSGHRRLPLAGDVPQRGRPDRAGRLELGADPPTRARPTTAPRTPAASAQTIAGDARDVQRRPGDRVHQHDHRRARLPGQLVA